MKKILLGALLLLATCAGCTFTGSGSQAIDFNPFNIGSDAAALEPANEDYHFKSDYRESMGIRDNDPWDMR